MSQHSSDNEVEIYQFPEDEVDALAEEMALANEIDTEDEIDTEHDDAGSLEDFVVPDDEPLEGESSFVPEDVSESESIVSEELEDEE